MKVIFLHDVPRVGKKYDVKEVNGGYAVNFLLPRRLAEAATVKALLELERRQKEITIEREVQENLLIKNLEEIKGKVVHIKAKADEKGHLFAQVHKKEIVDSMKTEHRADINPEFIVLEKPIKAVGEFDVPVKLKDKKSSFKLVVEKI
ncbi:50S ribosomal protein L9 [Candidatus Nomurabacteria bacterium RIFCSPHIGHO2_02_FULL_42_19]|uniref:Large ribosomal subunit protein bL9 n=1 Tax=Candidatus Nomurabacteria bacterium RIFCSPHIGHO2_02_FULL_42_19 TaxID=1801756 RepID=A0A1F6W3B6_9BACT|nr:MAG: 50S ribosomal protein L9 [Candidatus Nomurabacteria bacterium RIFCSPHIGHO2_02_FULL_42_19]